MTAAGRKTHRAARVRLAVLAALLAICMMGCTVRPILLPVGPSAPTETPPSSRPLGADETGTSEPQDADAGSSLSFDRETGILRIVGTGGYERLDLRQANDAKTVELEDDSFQLTLSVSVVKAELQQESFYIPNVEGVRVSDILPRFLYSLDGSTPTVRRFVAAYAPNEEVIAQTEKPVRYVVSYAYNYKNGPDQIVLNLGKPMSWHSFVYTLGLLNVKTKGWQHLGFACLVEKCVDPYSYRYTDLMQRVVNHDYYTEAYFRAGGSGRLEDPMERRLMLDANSWYNLIYGRDWPGTDAERGTMNQIEFFSGDMRQPGNDMSLYMAASLLNFLADGCGMDQVEAYCFDTCSFEEAFGMSFSEARTAWEQSLLDRFGDGGETPMSLSARRMPGRSGELR